MSRRPPFFGMPLSTNPFAMWAGLAARSTEMLLASGEVIATRSQRMATMGSRPGARDRREMSRMVDEKTDAMTESMQAMSTRAAGLYQASMLQWCDLATRQVASLYGIGRAPRIDREVAAGKAMQAAVQIAGAGLAPFHRRAIGNARRLRKPR